MAIEITLTKGHVTVIDESDAHIVHGKRWRSVVASSGKVYAATGKRAIYLHRLILRPKRGQSIDHINGDGLDNRRSNLRVCDHASNMRNRVNQAGGSSRFKGVWLTPSGKWRAGLQLNGKRISLGYFTSESDAARAYDIEAVKLYGEFAKTNSSLGLL